MTWSKRDEAGGRWLRRGENDQHWFIPDVLLSGWCRQNTSLHPIPSHYLPAITAVQWVSYRVINTSTRPHTAPTSSSKRHLMTVKDRQRVPSLSSLPRSSLFVNILQQPRNAFRQKSASSRQLVAQTLHLKWHIKATCLRISHMIDVRNDSVFSVWKSYVCFSPHLEPCVKRKRT